MVLLQIPTAVQQITGVKGFKYQASDGQRSIFHTSFVRDFAAMAAPQLRVRGGPRSFFTFWLFLIEGNASYQELFTE